jgi:hypothetical protein
MYTMLEDSGYTADRAEATQKQALEAANYAHSLSVGMKKLLAELQKDLDRPHSWPPSDRSQTRPEPVTAPEDEHQTPSQIRDGSQQIEPLAVPGQTQEGVLSKALQRDLDVVCQRLGLLYEANADLTAISEAVSQAREARMILECHKRLN